MRIKFSNLIKLILTIDIKKLIKMSLNQIINKKITIINSNKNSNNKNNNKNSNNKNNNKNSNKIFL